MKSILISIQPQWVAKILNGEKTIEIRNTIPKEWKEYLNWKTSIKPEPSKWYIYCTNGNRLYDLSKCGVDDLEQKVKEKKNKRFILSDLKSNNIIGSSVPLVNRKVVAEFTLNEVDIIEICDPDVLVNEKIVDVMEYIKQTCLSFDNFIDYIGYGDDHDGWGNKEWDISYALHIDDLKVYDKPKELNEFSVGKAKIDCGYGNYNIYNKILKRPPQSWCYVEEFNNGKH